MTVLSKKRCSVILFCCAVLLVRTEILLSAETTPQATDALLLHTCRDDQFGVKFLCDTNWELEIHDDAVLLIISSDPAVTMTVAKTATPLTYLSQMNIKFLEDMGNYSDGFQTEQTRLAGHDAVKVKAFSREFPEVRVLDYYILRDKNLYSVLFSVNPKEEWERYKFFIKQIVDSFSFIE